jgi:hypothetical protein
MGHTRLTIVAAFLFHSIVARLAGSYICMFVMSMATFSPLDVLLMIVPTYRSRALRPRNGAHV